MNINLLITCVLCALGGAAYAQSSNTVYGVVDTGLVRESGGAAGNVTKLTGGVESGTRLGFRGVEDLGGGLRALYTLEMGILADTGASGQGGLAFGRQAWVGIGGAPGQISLGRQYTPLFLALNTIDPFGAVSTAGTAANLMSIGGIRMNNTIKYSLADLGGFNADVSYGLGEVAGDNTAGRQIGALLGYTSGPLNIKLAYHTANSVPTAQSPSSVNGRTTMVGATYDFNVVKVAAAVAVNKGAVSVSGTPQIDSRDILVGATVPLGAGKLMASYIKKDDRTGITIRDARQWGIGYTYLLSKRTALYTAYGRINNTAAAGQPGFYTVGNASDLGTGDRAFNLGIRHSF